MNIQRAKPNIGQISLATPVTQIVIILSVHIPRSSGRFITVVQVFVRELVLGVEHLVLMHYLRALL